MASGMFKSRSKFMLELERSLCEDLKRIKKFESQASLEEQQLYFDTVLDAHRKAFESLLSHITTFKPQLLDIKKAYENALNGKNKIIRADKIVLNAIGKERENCNITIEKFYEENSLLKQKLCDTTEEVDALMIRCSKLEKEALNDHIALSVERDARHALHLENLKLKNENEQLREKHGSNKSQDPIVLKLALDLCRKDLSKVNSKLTNVLEEYVDAVPKKDFETLEIKYMYKSDEWRNTKKQLNNLQAQYDDLKEEFEKITEDSGELRDKLDELERSGTPRPKWDICGEFIGGGTTRWKQLTKGRSSGDKLEIILKELGPISQRSNLEYFEGFGFDPIIPEYLQYEGQVRNLKLSRRDLSILINDIWNAKCDKHVDSTMQDFLKDYFTERYQQQSIRAEWAYNLYSGCEQILDDPQIKLFWGVLNGTLSQDLYYSYKKEWNNLKDKIMDDYIKNQRFITLEEIERAIKKMYPLKSDMELKYLSDAIKKQLKIRNPSQEIDVHKLFSENEEGFERSDLAKEIYRQRQQSQEKYIREIVMQLGGKKNYAKLISVENLKRAFAIIDPHIDHIIMEYNVRWVYSDKTSNLNMIYPLSLKSVASKLMAGNIQRVGPRYRSRSVKIL